MDRGNFGLSNGSAGASPSRNWAIFIEKSQNSGMALAFLGTAWLLQKKEAFSMRFRDIFSQREVF
jgi:hypothetical protein